MPSFKKSPPELVARFGRVAAQVPGAARKQMFGYPVCVVSGNMFMGLHEDYLFLRLAAPERAGLIERLVARLFEPMPGRPMTEYVVIPAEIIEGPTIDDWVQRSFASAQTLPPKTPKTPKTERIVMAHAEQDRHEVRLSEHTNKQWRSGVLDVSKASGDGAGAIYRQIMKGPGGRKIKATTASPDFERPTRLAFEVIAGPARPTGSYELRPESPTSTSVTFTLDLEPRGVAKIMGLNDQPSNAKGSRVDHRIETSSGTVGDDVRCRQAIY